MRISDWNSDVCSSDLTRRRQLPTAGTADRSRKADPRLSRQRRFEQGNSAPYFRLRKHRQVSLEEHLLEARSQQSPASDQCRAADVAVELGRLPLRACLDKAPLWLTAA